MLAIDSKRKKKETIEKKYPGFIIADVTSKSTYSGLVKLSPFYPHCGIPIPFYKGHTASCVEAIWQGLKVFKDKGIDKKLFSNISGKNLKRTVRKNGKPLGHLKIDNGELLDYIEARKQIYIPAYKWVLENKVIDIIEKFKKALKQGKDIVLLDYTTNCEINNPKQPLSHAWLIKAFIENSYPM